jgi:hypothetical protein
MTVGRTENVKTTVKRSNQQTRTENDMEQRWVLPLPPHSKFCWSLIRRLGWQQAEDRPHCQILPAVVGEVGMQRAPVCRGL